MSRLPIDAVRRHRGGQGPVVVMLHCLGVDHRVWDHAAASLEAYRTVLRYDFAGHHEAPLPAGPYGIEDLSDQLARVLDAENIEKAAVVGISLGGLVAQHFAATHPERTEAVVLCDTTPRYTDASRQGWAERAATARTKGVTAMVDRLLDIWFTPAFVARNPPAVRYVRDCFAKVSGEGYALACEALAVADLRPLLARIKAPTLVVCGDEDVPDFQAAARFLAHEIAHARLVWLSPARHASPLEQPEEFAAALRTFLPVSR
ncbi:MAG: alpha/beta fold hydrolase [Variibacter sp.]|nr:alpha/beta fold hydrolase [Variibacter sp.]